MREIAPDTGLRRWFGHDPARWEEFQRRYRAELKGKAGLPDELREIARDHMRDRTRRVTGAA